jgi:hypothetical protein
MLDIGVRMLEMKARLTVATLNANANPGGHAGGLG